MLPFRSPVYIHHHHECISTTSDENLTYTVCSFQYSQHTYMIAPSFLAINMYLIWWIYHYYITQPFDIVDIVFFNANIPKLILYNLLFLSKCLLTNVLLLGNLFIDAICSKFKRYIFLSVTSCRLQMQR